MTPDIARLIMFLSIVTAIQSAIDYYVYRKFKNYLETIEVTLPFWKQAYFTIGAIMLMMLIGTTIERLLTGSNVQSGRILQMLIAIWYLPKYPLAIIFLIKDSIKGTHYLLHRYARKKDISSESPISIERRKVLHTIGATASIIPFIATAQGVLKTIYDIEVKNIDIVLPGLSRQLDGIRILQISDIHTGSYFGTGYLEEAVRIINEQKSDIIAATGDFVNFDPSELQLFLPTLRKLTADIGVFASLGNHDHYMTAMKHVQLQDMITSTGMNLLVNQSKVLTINNAQLVMAGTDNTGFNQKFGNLEQTFKYIPREITSILMAHDPTFWKMEILNSGLADLTLSGHTHGGQVGIEFLGEAYSPAQFVYEQWSGLYSSENKYLYVNRGLGTVGPPIRVGIPPEITVLTLRSPIA